MNTKKQETDTAPTPTMREPKWATLSAATGYKVLTLPDGSTIDASTITGVRWYAPEPDGSSFPYQVGRPCSVILRISSGLRDSTSIAVMEDAEAFFKIATAAHRAAASSKGDNSPVKQLGDRCMEGS